MSRDNHAMYMFSLTNKTSRVRILRATSLSLLARYKAGRGHSVGLKGRYVGAASSWGVLSADAPRNETTVPLRLNLTPTLPLISPFTCSPISRKFPDSFSSRFINHRFSFIRLFVEKRYYFLFHRSTCYCVPLDMFGS